MPKESWYHPLGEDCVFKDSDDLGDAHSIRTVCKAEKTL